MRNADKKLQKCTHPARTYNTAYSEGGGAHSSTHTARLREWKTHELLQIVQTMSDGEKQLYVHIDE